MSDGVSPPPSEPALSDYKMNISPTRSGKHDVGRDDSPPLYLFLFGKRQGGLFALSRGRSDLTRHAYLLALRTRVPFYRVIASLPALRLRLFPLGGA